MAAAAAAAAAAAEEEEEEEEEEDGGSVSSVRKTRRASSQGSDLLGDMADILADILVGSDATELETSGENCETVVVVCGDRRWCQRVCNLRVCDFKES